MIRPNCVCVALRAAEKQPQERPATRAHSYHPWVALTIREFLTGQPIFFRRHFLLDAHRNVILQKRCIWPESPTSISEIPPLVCRLACAMASSSTFVHIPPVMPGASTKRTANPSRSRIVYINKVLSALRKKSKWISWFAPEVSQQAWLHKLPPAHAALCPSLRQWYLLTLTGEERSIVSAGPGRPRRSSKPACSQYSTNRL